MRNNTIKKVLKDYSKMGNNRSNLISGSTATTASLNSTSSLPVNPMSATNSLHPHTNGSQSSVSFLKRFRNMNPSSHNCDELDHIDSRPAHRKKNKKLNTFTKKLKKPDSVDDFTSEANKKSTAHQNQKRIDKNKMISLSTSNITKNSKVSTNESEYTTINEYVGDNNNIAVPLKPSENRQVSQQLIVRHIKEESFYESTFDMDLPSATNVSQPVKRGTNKENEHVNQAKNRTSLAASPTDKANTNIYSEIVTKTSTSKTLPHTLQQPMPPTNPPPNSCNNSSNNKKNHLQPITNFFNKLTKTTAKPSCDSVPSEAQPPVAPAPVIPTKAFNPTKEFYSDYNQDVRRFDADEIEDEEDEEDGGIYSKIDKSTSNIAAKTKIPPLPTTLVPSTLLTDEIESCLSKKHFQLKFEIPLHKLKSI